MTKHLYSAVLAAGLYGLLAGCAVTPTVNDFAKQEFIARDEKPIHVALRGSRRDRRLTCQVFLLTAAESLWLSRVDLKTADGSVLVPREVKSLDPRPSRGGPTIGFGFGIPLGGSSRGSGGGSDCHTGSGGSGSSSARIPVGAAVPIGKLLKGLAKDEAPKSLQLTYDLPDNASTCDGAELTVCVASSAQQGKDEKDKGPATASSKKADDGGAPTSAKDGETPATAVMSFGLCEKPLASDDKDEPSEQKDQTQEKTKQLVREIQFTLKQKA